MTSTALDIVLPFYNPAANWAENVMESIAEIKKKLPDVELHLILINDGSSHPFKPKDIDKIKTVMPALTQIEYEVNKGKGHALREGVKISTAPFCIYTDIDFPYTTNSFVRIWESLNKEEADIVVGVKDKNYYKHVPPVRKYISKILRACSKFILRLKISDTQCGLKGFNSKGKKVFLETSINRYLFDLEFIFLASRNTDIVMLPKEIELKDNIQFSSMRSGILLSEGFNFIKIFFKSL